MTQLKGGRYDPTAADAADWEVQKKARGAVYEEDAPDGGEGAEPANRVHQTEAPEVSKERFITINPNLKEAIEWASAQWGLEENGRGIVVFLLWQLRHTYRGCLARPVQRCD